MKKVLWLGLATMILAAVFLVWHSGVPTDMRLTSASQIMIHGTPVCIMQHGGDILAKVGDCPDSASPGGGIGLSPEDPRGGLQPGMRLPPGHPPVDREFSPDNRRRIPI